MVQLESTQRVLGATKGRRVREIAWRGPTECVANSVTRRHRVSEDPPKHLNVTSHSLEMALALPPALFRALLTKNLRWLDANPDLLMCEDAVSVEQLFNSRGVAAEAESALRARMRAAVDSLEDVRVEARMAAVRTILEVTVSGNVELADPEDSRFSGLLTHGARERCIWLVSLGALEPLACEVVAATQDCRRALEDSVRRPEAGPLAVERVAGAVTLLFWVLAVHAPDAEFCACFARLHVGGSRWALLIALATLVETTSAHPHACLPIRVVLLLLRLVLRVSLHGAGAAGVALRCGTGGGAGTLSAASASSGRGPARNAHTDAASRRSDVSASLFDALSSTRLPIGPPSEPGAPPPSALERLLVGILVLLLAYVVRGLLMGLNHHRLPLLRSYPDLLPT